MNFLVIFVALIISWLVFTALLKIVKTTVTTALTIAFLVLALQLLWGISPQTIWQQIQQFWQAIIVWVQR
ncbi:hypothetical protein [Trichothermofontia sp.]